MREPSESPALRSGGAPAQRGGRALAIVILALLLASCPLSTLAIRVRLAHAREICTSIRPGTPRADVEALLAHELGAIVLGYAGTVGLAHAPSVDFGRRGTVVSWECEVELDPHDVTTRASFVWWITPDFHGSWDDRARDFLEENLL